MTHWTPSRPAADPAGALTAAYMRAWLCACARGPLMFAALSCVAAPARYDAEGQPVFASARLWDDGVIDPADTRRILGLSLAAALQRAPEATRFGVFRM